MRRMKEMDWDEIIQLGIDFLLGAVLLLSLGVWMYLGYLSFNSLYHTETIGQIISLTLLTLVYLFLSVFITSTWFRVMRQAVKIIMEDW